MSNLLGRRKKDGLQSTNRRLFKIIFIFIFRRTRHGYLNDDFIDDEGEYNDDQEWEMDFTDDETPKQKKRRGRPKKIKEEELEELQHYDDEGDESPPLFVTFIYFLHITEELEDTILEPIVKVKEEEIERKYHEYNEFFAAGEEIFLMKYFV